MATSLDGYNSHCSFTDRQKAPTALWDIWREGGREGEDGETQQHTHADEQETGWKDGQLILKISNLCVLKQQHTLQFDLVGAEPQTPQSLYVPPFHTLMLRQ